MWAKISDDFFRNPKVVTAGRDARDLYLVGLCHCNEHLTDGFIDGAYLRRLAADAEIDDAKDAVAKLVEVGLWHEAERGYQVHDFDAHNILKAEVEAKAEKAKANAERQEKWRESQRNALRNASPNALRASLPVPDPVSGTMSQKGEGLPVATARETPSADPLPPPPLAPDDSEQKLPTADPDAVRLYEAFRSVRFPKSIPTDWQPGEWHKDLPNLRQMARRGISPAQVIERTERAIARGFPSVTLNAIWSNWGDLGDDLPALPDPVPKRLGRGESIAHAAAALDDDYAALEAAYAQKGIAA
jgi:hypothetical protein